MLRQHFHIPPKRIGALISLVDEGKVSNAIAEQRIFPALLDEPDKEPLQIAQDLNVIQSSDASFLEDLADEAIAAFPDKVEAYRNGKTGLLGLFMGELMKKSRGKADPKVASEILKRKLEG